MQSKCCILIISLILTGCIAMMPSDRSNTSLNFSSFNIVVEQYNLVIPEITTVSELIKIGFDPYTSLNVKILTYTDIIQRFMPNNVSREDLTYGIAQCISAKDRCLPFIITAGDVNKQRIGNILLDLFQFKKEVEITGWKFEALFIIIDGIVVYKIYEGQPKIYEHIKQVKPLGPVQSIGDQIISNIK